VGRTVAAAATGVRLDGADPFLAIRREAQLLVGYRRSPIVGAADEALPPNAPQAGDRAPDARGLVRDIVRFPVRLFELFRTPGHALLLLVRRSTATACRSTSSSMSLVEDGRPSKKTSPSTLQEPRASATSRGWPWRGVGRGIEALVRCGGGCHDQAMAVLMERDAPLVALESALVAAIAGAGSVVLLSGEAGIAGATYLVLDYLLEPARIDAATSGRVPSPFVAVPAMSAPT
jgi:hypothetical protein